MTDEAVPPEAPPPPVVAPEPPPPPKKRFVRPLFFWWLVFSLPISMIAGTVAIYIHESAHGLVALATGGYFLGIRMAKANPRAPTMAYADAWSDGYETPVYLAGILICVAIGSWALWKACRTRPVVRRGALLLVASAFLGNLDYALEGALFWKTTDYDTAVLLKTADSVALRWIVLVLLSAAVTAKTFVIGRRLFQCWEDVFGPFTRWKSFWVILFLGFTVPVTTVNEEGAVWAMSACTAMLIVLFIWLIRGRRETVETAAVERVGRWCWASWGGAAIAGVGMLLLYRGISLGSYKDVTVHDIRPERSAVVGTVIRYGTLRHDGTRSILQRELFRSTPEGVQVVPSPKTEILDLTWIPATDRFVLAAPDGVHEVDAASGQATLLWAAKPAVIKSAKHGPGGELLLVAEYWSSPTAAAVPSIYTYDPRRKEVRHHETNGAVGNPWFTPSTPVQALITVGQDVWTFSWPVRDDVDVLSEREEGASAPGWLEGISSDRRWWYDAEGWRCDDVRVRHEKLTNWGIGRDGFYALHEAGRWQLTTPKGNAEKGGDVKTSSVLLLQFPQGVPWIVLRDGEVRRLEREKPEFHAKFPKLR